MKPLLVATVLLLIPGCTVQPVIQTDESFAWAEMCDIAEELYGYSCSTVSPPTVIYEEMKPNTWGTYLGDDVIYINDSLTRDQAIPTLIHEMVHYLHNQSGIYPIPGPAALVCASEDEAWTIEGEYSGEDKSGWWRNYQHCWPYYGDYKNLYGRIMLQVQVILSDIIEEIIQER